MHEPLNPSAWAQTLLAIMVDPDDHEAIAGDLIEEFRDEKVPTLGLPRARRWYSAQVLGYVWRSSWMWFALLAVWFIAADLSNQFRQPDGSAYFRLYTPIPFVAPAVFLTAGFLAGRRTRSVVAGLLVAAIVQATLLAFMATWWSVTLYPFAQVIEHNPYWIQAWHYSGEGQSFLAWSFYDDIGAVIMATIVLLPAATLCGTAGAFVGKLTRGQ